jgi:hypothetical protein
MVGALGVMGSLGVGAVVLAVLGGVPAMAQVRVSSWVQSQVDQSVNADVAVGQISVSLLRSFPRIDVRLDDLIVTGRAPFEGVVLLQAGELGLGLDLFSALSGSDIQIESVRITDTKVNVVIDEDGLANYDIAADADGPEPASSTGLAIDALDVSDLSITYHDRSSSLFAVIEDIAFEATAGLSSTLAEVNSQGTIASMTVDYGGVRWLSATEWTNVMAVTYDQASGAIELGDNELVVNALPLAFRGNLAPEGDDWRMDLGFEAKQTTFAALLSLIPAAYGDAFSGVDAQGKVSMNGTAKGLYTSEGDHLPAFDLALRIDDAAFQFPELPVGVDHVSAIMAVHHDEGPSDLTSVDVSSFKVTAGGSTLGGRVKVTHPISDPTIDSEMDGQLNLGAMSKAMPPGGSEMSGVLDVDFVVAGASSDFEAGRAEKVVATGTIVADDLAFRAEGQEPLHIKRLDLTLSPQRADVRRLAMDYAGSDVAVTGSVDNLVSWAMTEDAVLRGDMRLESNTLDMRPFQAESAEPGEPVPVEDPEDDTALVAVPQNVDLTFDADIKELKTEDFNLSQVDGRMTVNEGTVTMRQMKAKMLGGEAVFSGTYTAETTEKADVDVNIEAVRFDLAAAVETFETLAIIAPFMKGTSGHFDSGFSVATSLASDGSPDLSMLSSSGLLSPAGVRVRPATLDEVATSLKQDGFKSLDLSGVNIAYAMNDGRVVFQPFDAKLGKTPATVSGSAGVLDQTLDLAMDMAVPTAKLASAPFLSSMASLPAKADVTVTLKGTWDKPKVGVQLKGAEALVDGVVDEAKAKVEGAVDDLVAGARLQGDKLIAAAQAQSDKLVAEGAKAAGTVRKQGKTQAKKVRDEGKGNPVKAAAANEVAKQIEKESNKSANKLENEAKAAGAKLVNAAKDQMDKLIEQAEAKMKAQLN